MDMSLSSADNDFLRKTLLKNFLYSCAEENLFFRKRLIIDV